MIVAFFTTTCCYFYHNLTPNKHDKSNCRAFYLNFKYSKPLLLQPKRKPVEYALHPKFTGTLQISHTNKVFVEMS